jgi:branched-chain amino acid transport system substrate-binding protein
MGGDGMYSPNYIKLAGKTSEGDLATSVGAPTESLDTAKAFVDDYEAGGYKEPYEAYGAYSYDAANAIINALKTSLADAEDAKSAREATVEAMSKVSFGGATGDVAFDEFGDTTTKVLTVYKVEGGKFVADKTEEFK